MELLLTVVVLTAMYSVAIVGLIVSLHRLRIGGKRTIVLGFVSFGALSGLLTAWAWPLDSAVYANVYAVLLADQVYTWAIRYLGDPHSANAHNTIPSILQVPQVYVLVSLVVSGLAGSVVQWMFDRRTPIHSGGQ